MYVYVLVMHAQVTQYVIVDPERGPTGPPQPTRIFMTPPPWDGGPCSSWLVAWAPELWVCRGLCQCSCPWLAVPSPDSRSHKVCKNYFNILSRSEPQTTVQARVQERATEPRATLGSSTSQEIPL